METRGPEGLRDLLTSYYHVDDLTLSVLRSLAHEHGLSLKKLLDLTGSKSSLSSGLFGRIRDPVNPYFS
jgi:antitoxin component HigA of HigAB toxin-antitoxin module